MVAVSRITRERFGFTPDGHAIERVVLCGDDGFEARVITLGAALQALLVPDANGCSADVVLGHDDLAGYLGKRGFFGATVGRYANRIANARFVLDGTTYQLAANNGPHSLHGGLKGFDTQLWRISAIEDGARPAVTLSYVSADGEEGFPGRLEVSVSYRLTGPVELSLTISARTDRPTIVNLTNHSFFNLEGALANATVLDHRLTLAAGRFLAIDPTAIPLGGLPRPVAGTPFDFRDGAAIGARIRQNDEQLRNGRGYDHNFCLDNSGRLGLAARLEAPISGRVLELLTDQPGVQFYSGNYLDGATGGKGGRLYRQSDGLCLEPQIWPDAPNRPDFPSPRLTADREYQHRIVYRFSAR